MGKEWCCLLRWGKLGKEETGEIHRICGSVLALLRLRYLLIIQMEKFNSQVI